MMTKVSIAVFAHNEAACIGSMLKELRKQTLFQQAPPPSLVVLENGSTDNTVELAQKAIDEEFQEFTASVVSLDIGDKGNAWNYFVHHESPDDAETLIFIDADIELGTLETLQNLVTDLGQNPDADVTVSRPLKDIEKKEERHGLESLSLAASAAAEAGPAKLCGQLYCGRSEPLRQIQIPLGLLVEDGFLRAMILTRLFSEAEQVGRIIQTAETFHYFEAVTNPGELIKHEVRIAIGTELNIMLFAGIKELIAKNEHVSTSILEKNKAEPEWVKNMALQQRKNGTFSFHSSGFIFKQWQSWKLLSPKAKLRSFPGLAARIALNTHVAAVARKTLKSGEWTW